MSDFYEGGNATELVKRVAQLVQSGVNVIVLLALNDDGVLVAYHHELAQRFATLARRPLPARPFFRFDGGCAPEARYFLAGIHAGDCTGRQSTAAGVTACAYRFCA